MAPEIKKFANRAATEAWATTFGRDLKRPCAVLLDGPMGAGKTQLVRWFATALGADPAAVVSPTFSIHQQYATAEGDIDHVDLYRLTSAADLESSGFWDLLRQARGMLFVEWSNRLPDDVWPKPWLIVKVELMPLGGEGRSVSLTKL